MAFQGLWSQTDRVRGAPAFFGTSNKKRRRKKKEATVLGGGGYRSPYLPHAKRTLYHVSYTPDINVSREKTSLPK